MIKKTIKIMMTTFLLVAGNVANALGCPENFHASLHHYLKANISEISWLDINSVDSEKSCQFNIRYYPCSASVDKQLLLVIPSYIQKNL